MYLFVVLRALCCRAWAFSSWVSGGYSLAAMCRLLILVVSLVAEHGLKGTQTSVAATRRLSSYGSWTLEPRLSSCGVWT